MIVWIMKNYVIIVLIRMAWLELDECFYLSFWFLLAITKSDSSTFEVDIVKIFKSLLSLHFVSNDRLH